MDDLDGCDARLRCRVAEGAVNLTLSRVLDRRFRRFRQGRAHGHTLHGYAEGTLELEQLGALIPREERGSNAGGAGSSGTADAVDEVLSHLGQVVVDDVSDVFNVDAAGREVRGNQDAEASLLKAFESRGALGLRTIAMNHGGVDAQAREAIGNAIGAALGARENEAEAGFAGEQAAEHVRLAVKRDFERLELHAFAKASA